MKHKVLATLAVASALAWASRPAAAASSGGGSKTTATGKTLVVESTPLSPMTDTFNPFSLTSTGYLTNAVALYNEPLFIFNTLNSAQAPIPMLATGDSYSNGGKTLTLTIRKGVKWNDGKPFSAADVAFTFNMLKANPKLNTNGAPVVTSASAPSATSAVLNFKNPQYANLFLIGQVYIVPQHVWSSVSDPATFADAKPVGTGPFMLDKFSPQGYTLKANPFYWNKSKVHVPEIDFPAYNTNANLVPPVSSGQIDFAGNYIANIKDNFLAKSPENHTWLSSRALLQRQQRGEHVPEHHEGPAERPRGAPGDQLRDQPLAAQRPGRDRATSRRSTRPAGCCCPTTSRIWTPRWPTTSRPPVTRPRSPRSSRRTATPSRAASGPRTGRRSSSPSRTRSRTATTTPTTSSSPTS